MITYDFLQDRDCLLFCRLFGNQGSSACASNLDVSSFAKIKMPSESTVIESQVRISVDVPEAGILITLDPRLDLSPHNMDATDTRVSCRT